MVNPINGDKPITLTTEPSLHSNRTATKGRGEAEEAPARTHDTETTATNVQIDGARQLFELEQSRPDGALETPEQARSLLDQVLERLGTTPQAVMQAQTGNASATLANLLSAPQ
ncbi:hypothetical protein [endosymbiont of Lamellibrachia barhami]|uniref:hypothetical protein n=1 Tax=endosymbiont of Lamellibrachia barhami TaxID=205975 RepID=UPI0015AC59AC|nr:hypothetical protein [endosymbiont of Lamellibrachia barhami]